MSKHALGQFMTTNYEYILQNMHIPNEVDTIIEPFVGNGDLLKFIKNKKKYKIEKYDIDKKYKKICIMRDTLDDPPDYSDKFIITNPPFLARNKSKNKKLFDKYDVNDLYKCFIKELITNICLGGIIIVPLNFWCSIRKNDIELRKLFLDVYHIIHINIFEERVFDDTTYTISCFQFEQIKKNTKINVTLYPSEKNIQVQLNHKNNYTIGGEIYNLEPSEKYKISRLTKLNKDDQNTNILVKCIDDNQDKKISMSYVSDNDIYTDNTPNQTSRTYMTLIITPKINVAKQKKLVTKFNKYLNTQRNKYNSLFLTNYRESKDIARKRISFDLVYLITQNILDNFDEY